MMASASFEGLGTRVRQLRHAALSRMHGDSVMLALAVAVGFGTGVAAAVLVNAIELVERIAFGTHPDWLRILLVPTAGGLAAGILITYLFPESAGSGVIEIMKTISLRGGRVRSRVPAGGIITTGVALGTGASGGREGPIVLVGGGLGSLAGRLFAVGEDRMRTLVAAGVAAGIGASFNAPIGGMLFAIELIIGGFKARSLQVIVVSSVVGSVTARQLIGPEVIFKPSASYRLADPRELLLYVVLGLAAAGVGIAFLRLEDFFHRLFTGMRVWRPLTLAIAGAGVGSIALILPEVLSTGDGLPPISGIRDPIQEMLEGGFGSGYAVVGFLLLLAAAKLIATSMSIGSGNAIGTFAPALFTGAAVGGALGHLALMWFPATGVEPGAFALVGMAAAFSAAARAPLTAIVIAFELTGDYELVLPLMLAAGIATLVADRINPDSVYTYPLRKQGIVYAEPEDVDIMQSVSVGEIMTTGHDAVPASMPVAELRRLFATSGHHGFPVLGGDGRLTGVVTMSDLARADEEETARATGERAPPHRTHDGAPHHRRPHDGVVTVDDICTHQPVTVTPDDPVFRAVRRMASLDVGRVPVVSSEDHGILVGLLRRSDLVKAYQRAVVRNLGAQQRRQWSQLRDLGGVQFVELRVEAGAPSDGKPVKEIAWPQRTVLTSVRRDGQVVLPRGDTVLQAGDEVVVLTGRDTADEVHRLMSPIAGSQAGAAADG